MNRLCNTRSGSARDEPRRPPWRSRRHWSDCPLLLANGDCPRYFGGSEPGVESSSGNVVAPDCAGADGVLVGSVTGDAVADDVLPPVVRMPAVPCAMARSKRFAASAFVLT